MFQQRFNVLLSNIDMAGAKQQAKTPKRGALISLIKKRILESASEYKMKQQQIEKRATKLRRFAHHKGRRFSKEMSGSSHSSENVYDGAVGQPQYFSQDEADGRGGRSTKKPAPEERKTNSM